MKNVVEPPNLNDEVKFTKLKQSIIKEEDIEKVKHSWIRLLKEIEKLTNEISDDYIPIVDWKDLKGTEFKGELADKFKERGVLIVRNVVSTETAQGWLQLLKDFTQKHPEVGGFQLPPVNWFVFWNKAQVEARSHPEILEMMKIISNVFYVEDETLPIDIDSQVVYADSFRIRKPGKALSLDLHLDSGSTERWEDPGYRSVYQAIFEGRWEDYEPFKLDARSLARSDLYTHLEGRNSACSAFRSLQGWLSLSESQKGDGTLRVLPNIKLITAYIMLRPFFWKDDGEIDLETPKFPGAVEGSGQFFISEEFHPHLKPLQTVLAIPNVNFGDYVFWHCDLAHEVEKVHSGPDESSVLYYGISPLCPYNIDNLLHMNESFRAVKTPRDFQSIVQPQQKEGDYHDHGANISNILSNAGLRSMGFMDFDINEIGLTSGQIQIRKLANEILNKP